MLLDLENYEQGRRSWHACSTPLTQLVIYTYERVSTSFSPKILFVFFQKLSGKMRAVILATVVAAVSAFTGAPLKTSFKSSSDLNMALFKKKLDYVPCIPLKFMPEPGRATSGVAGGLAICIAVDPNGSVYALGDKCPPVNQPLSFGTVNSDGTIQDPVLGTKFSLKTGEVVDWCPSGLGRVIGGVFTPTGVPSYPVRQRGGNLEIQVDVNAKANFEANYWKGVLDAQGKSDGSYY